MIWKNRVTDILGINYPIIQAPMFGVTTPEMVAASLRSGVLGTLALGDLTKEETFNTISTTKKLTDSRFAVNIFVHDLPIVDDLLITNYDKMRNQLIDIAKENNIDVELPKFEDIQITNYHDQIDTILNAGCSIVSFTFGNLDTQSIQYLHEKGVILIGTCTSVEEVQLLEFFGIDLICLQGIEAGGHRGCFTSNGTAEINGFSVLKELKDRVKTPIIYAGGIYNAQTLMQAQYAGAEGFQIGSALLNSKESGLLEFEKKRLTNRTCNDTVLTNSFSGRFARGLKNEFTTMFEKRSFILPYPYQNKLTQPFRKAFKEQANTDFINLWIGEKITDLSFDSVENIFNQIISETEHSFLK